MVGMADSAALTTTTATGRGSLMSTQSRRRGCGRNRARPRCQTVVDAWHARGHDSAEVTNPMGNCNNRWRSPTSTCGNPIV
jgi:hypothetical protein